MGTWSESGYHKCKNCTVCPGDAIAVACATTNDTQCAGTNKLYIFCFHFSIQLASIVFFQQLIVVIANKYEKVNSNYI